MNKKRIISPSLLSANFTRLKEDIRTVEDLGIKRLHLDVMDGHFVPNLTFGPFIINDIKKITNSHLETHLMIENPRQYLDDYINAGSDTIIIHYEATDNPEDDLSYIKSKNIKAGIAINPNTDYKLFGKPSSRPNRRMGVALAYGSEPVQKLVKKAKQVSQWITLS